MATETTYGRHVIRSMKISGDWNARAFRGKAAIGPVHSGATEEAAIGAARAAIDADHAAQRAARGPEGFPTAAEVRAALAVISITAGQHALLTANLLAPDHTMTQIGKK